MPLTCAEISRHPAFQHVIHSLPPTKKDTLSVAKDRGGPFNISYEIHGNGPIHLVVGPPGPRPPLKIMHYRNSVGLSLTVQHPRSSFQSTKFSPQWIGGLGAFKWYWQRQTKDFGHDQSSKYSCLIFDNRGMGESDKPIMRYSTLEMARDILELLDHIEWTSSRQIHLVGISMGGMIAQELVQWFFLPCSQANHGQVLLEPERIASLTLVSTAAQLINTIVRKNILEMLISLLSYKISGLRSTSSRTYKYIVGDLFRLRVFLCLRTCPITMILESLNLSTSRLQRSKLV